MAFVKEIGRIIAKGEIKTGPTTNGGTWSRQDCVIEVTTGENSHKDVAVSLNTEQIEQLKNVPLGAVIEVEYYVTAREWNGRWFNNVNAKEVKVVTPAAPAPAPAPAPAAPAATTPVVEPQKDFEPKEDDLPF